MAPLTNVALVAVILAVVAVNVRADSLVIGQRQIGDELACYGDVHLPAQPGKVVSATRICSVPKPNQRVTHISALDTGVNGKGGYAVIQSGGMGQRSVSLYLWSQAGQPLDFSLNIFSK